MLAPLPLVDDEQTEFKFSDLSPRAKENARDRYRADGLIDDWWDVIYEDVLAIAGMIGLSIDEYPVSLTNGQLRVEPKIWFSGFASQGDGACFEGRWSPVPDPMASLAKVMDHAPTDERLHEIAFELALLSERCARLIPDATVTIRHSSMYCHAYSVSFEVDLPEPEDAQDWNDLQRMTWQALCRANGLDDDTFDEIAKRAFRSLMDWTYRQLEKEHDYLTSDEAVDEALADQMFDEDGETI